MTATPEEVAWAAGLFEGEGCFYARPRKGGTMKVIVSLGMTDPDVVQRFASIIGCGTIYESDRSSGSLRYHTWQLQDSAKIPAVVTLLMPHLGMRRRAKAEELLTAVATMPRRRVEESASGFL